MTHTRKQTRPMKITPPPRSPAPSPSASITPPPRSPAPSPPRSSPSASTSTPTSAATSLLFNLLTMGVLSGTSAPAAANPPPAAANPQPAATSSTPAATSSPTAAASLTLGPERRRSTSSSSSSSSSSSRSSRSPSPPSQRPFSPLSQPSPVPSLISPLSVTPPKPAGLNTLSEKFNALNAIRRQSFLPPNECSYIFQKSGKLHSKGERCTRICSRGQVMCSSHQKPGNRTCASNSKSRPVVNLKHTRINRLVRKQKYYFVKVIDSTRFMVELKCGERHYSLRLPRGMVNPEFLSIRDYLIRGDDGEARWEY